MNQTVCPFQDTPQKQVSLKIEDSNKKIRKTTHMRHIFVLFRKNTRLYKISLHRQQFILFSPSSGHKNLSFQRNIVALLRFENMFHFKTTLSYICLWTESTNVITIRSWINLARGIMLGVTTVVAFWSFAMIKL